MGFNSNKYSLDLNIQTCYFKDLSRLVETASGSTVPLWKAIVGRNAFAHEAGIHAHSVLKNPLTYEPFAPEEVGWQGRFTVGKHSGRHLLSNVLQQYGITVNPSETQFLLDQVRNLSVQVKRSLTVEEFVNLAKNYSSTCEQVRST